MKLKYVALAHHFYTYVYTQAHIRIRVAFKKIRIIITALILGCAVVLVNHFSLGTLCG